MYISEIILDGFKSYANRTVISGFDQNFNAITGLNGSGKSNILDAICFVLGISNLSHVRVGNLQELVYKQGQAGITKASVTIVFNNHNKVNSPVGYELYDDVTVTRQIVIGGKNKYLINGHVAQLSRIHNLFHSIQLNINNPHFLIMQGRITKVLNMKPPEILGMIEEAAGTKMFEMKKDNAIKTIEKKNNKLVELQTLLDKDITPTLDKLRGERDVYLTWSKNQQELERLRHFCLGYDYVTLQSSIQNAEGIKIKNEKLILQLENEVETLTDEQQSIDTHLSTLKSELNLKKTKEEQQLDENCNNIKKSIIKIETNIKNIHNNIKDEEKNKQKIVNNMSDIQTGIETKNVELQKQGATLKSIQQRVATLETAYNDAQGKLRSLQFGFNKNGNGGCGSGGDAGADHQTDVEKLAQLQRALLSHQSNRKLKEMNIKNYEKEKHKIEIELSKVSKNSSTFESQLANIDLSIDELNSKIKSYAFNDMHYTELINKIIIEKQRIQDLNDKIDQFSTSLGSLNFEYSIKDKSFNHSKIKGMVAKCFQLKHTKYATGIEVVAGGRLYNVIVDDDETGKQLLQSGNLKKRVTIIPLNQITTSTISSTKVADVAAAMKANHHPTDDSGLALQFITFDSNVKSAMEYIFGKTYIVKNTETAKFLAYNKQYNIKCVTMDGDVYDPNGTLTGGSLPSSTTSSILCQLQSLVTLTTTLGHHQQSLTLLETEYNSLTITFNSINRLKQELELCQHQKSNVKSRLGDTVYEQINQKLKSISSLIIEESTAITTLTTVIASTEAEIQQMEDDIKNIKSKREQVIGDTEKQVNKMKQSLVSDQSQLRSQEMMVNEIKGEIDGMKLEISNLKLEFETCVTVIDGLVSERQLAQQQLHQEESKYTVAKSALSQHLTSISSLDQAIKQAQGKQDSILKIITTKTMDMKKLQHVNSKHLSDMDGNQHALHTLVLQHPWINEEKKYFNKSGSDYDYNNTDMKATQLKLSTLEVETEKLTKKINRKVLGIFDKVETEYFNLLKKKEIVETDKNKIEYVIQDLDEKKNITLKETWTKVNKDFGAIFSTLLPGCTAKLDPPEGGTVLDGLEVKVAFGNVWKQSLTELSGGQRSLLALSLILSLLMYKPAPVYILDEVDAALDLSHTQNIGYMLRTYFSRSQFIVVSLKEGMFQNANVVFRTKFIDGLSTVQRTMNSIPSSTSSTVEEERENANGRGGKKINATANNDGDGKQPLRLRQ